MHRRAAYDVSSSFRHIFRRHRSGPGSHSKSRPPKPYQNRRYNKEEENLPVSQQLRNVISPEACEWLEGMPIKKGKAPSHTPLLFTQSQSSTMEKAMFDSLESTEHLLPLAGDDDVALTEDTRRIPAGSLVEVRRSEIATNGVVLFSVLLGRRWQVFTLTSSGEVWQHHEHDITFQIPNFISKKLAEEAGMHLSVKTEAELNARVNILKSLRLFEKRLEYETHAVPQMARSMSFYDLVAHPDPNTWTNITTREAAEKLYAKSFLSVQELFAAQTYLFSSGSHFVSEPRRFLQRPSFWIRPRQEVADIEAVTNMVLNRSPALSQFIEKARNLIVTSRERATEGWNEPPSRRPIDGVEWTAEDKTILRFFLASMQNRRIIQMDPFLVPTAQILKSLKLYNVDEYDSTAAHTFLLEMGVVAPWEEMNTRDGIRREEVIDLELKPSVPSPVAPSPLGPDDLYSNDIVERLRHNFGDLPVYVVDDWGAEELDDGVSVERIPSDPRHVWLHVHVADPTTLLPPAHRFARHAMQVSSTNYFVDRTVPMLPRDVGFHRFSLGGTPGQPNVVLTFSAKVNLDGDIVDYKVQPAIIRNVRTIRYDEVDALLGNEPVVAKYPFGRSAPIQDHSATPIDDPTTVEDFQLLQRVTASLGQSRFNRGALVFGFPNIVIKLEPRPLPQELMGTLEPANFRGFPRMSYGVASVEGGAHDIIAEAMKTAGRVASRFFRDCGVPALRRTVGPLKSELRGGIKTVMALRREGGLVDVFAALRERVSAPPGAYLPRPAMHSLMGIPDDEGYIKVTSPLRRFGDLLAHWQLKHVLLAAHGECASPVLFDEEWLGRMADDLAVRELAVRRTEGVQQTFWAHLFLLRWMNDPARDRRTHDPLRAIRARIIEVPTVNARLSERICQVYIPDLGLNGRLRWFPTDDPRGLGDEVEVEVVEVKLGTRPMLDLKLLR